MSQLLMAGLLPGKLIPSNEEEALDDGGPYYSRIGQILPRRFFGGIVCKVTDALSLAYEIQFQPDLPKKL